MKAWLALTIAIFDSLALFVIVSIGAWKLGGTAIIFSLFYYLTIVIIILGKLSVWSWVISECIADERQ